MKVDSQGSISTGRSFFQSPVLWTCLPLGYVGLFLALKLTTSLSFGWRILVTVLFGDIPGILLALLILGVRRLVGGRTGNRFLIILLILIGGCTGEKSNSGGSLLVIRLPDNVSDSFPPPPGMVTILRGIGPALSADDAPSRVALVSRSSDALDCGIIVLNALKEQAGAVTQVSKVRDVRGLNASSIVAMGHYSPADAKILDAIAPTRILRVEKLADYKSDAPIHAVVVLGNEPLDSVTPTVDTLARIRRAVEYRKEHHGAILIFSGGKTAGSVSEAWMMAVIALSLGVPADAIMLESEARSTSENAWFCGEIVESLNPVRVVILTSESHMEWALPVFRQCPVFADALPVTSYVSREARMKQMRQYLEHKDSARVRQRLEWLMSDTKGVD